MKTLVDELRISLLDDDTLELFLHINVDDVKKEIEKRKTETLSRYKEGDVYISEDHETITLYKISNVLPNKQTFADTLTLYKSHENDLYGVADGTKLMSNLKGVTLRKIDNPNVFDVAKEINNQFYIDMSNIAEERYNKIFRMLEKL